MTITNVNNPKELEQELKTKLTKFMENNEQFNVQGSWTGEDGVTVGVLVDFGIEDRDQGNYYVGLISAKYQDNLEILEEKGVITPPDEDGPTEIEDVECEHLREVLGESDTFMDAERAMVDAINQVFMTGRDRLIHRPECSDIDISSTIPIMFGEWPTTEEVDYNNE